MKPIYRSDGVAVALVHRGHLYNADGDWLGFLRGADVYDVTGSYLGYLSEDQRLLRKRNAPDRKRIKPPETWMPRLQGVPAHLPLAPLFKQLGYGTIDVFEENPDKFRFVSDLKPDME
jgi:hypothetical protein